MKIYHYIFSLTFFFATQTDVSGQSNNLIYYFDKDLNLTAASTASYLGYGVREKGKIKFSTYRIPSHTILMKGYFTDSTLAVKDGLFTYYDSLGFVESEGIYKDDREEGFWLFWEDRLSDSMYYEKGQLLTEVSFTYHPGTELVASRIFMNYKTMIREILQWDTTGRLISKGFSMKGDREIYTYYPNGKVKEIQRNVSDEDPSTRYFTETGEEITKEVEKEKAKNKPDTDLSGFPSGGDKPVYPGGRDEFFDFIKRNLKTAKNYLSTTLQRDGNPTGGITKSTLLKLSFMLDKKGHAKDIKVDGEVNPLKIELASLVGRMPSWKMNGLESYGPINIILNISVTYW
ncbi:MAG TPA: hypothetical protein VK483_12305 [Chitinophagaceae bacterium]|nr:hypothetical protein [Chitinophagaceae bacterium]